MFQKTCDFMVYALSTQWAISTWVLAHFLACLTHVSKTCGFLATCFRNMCFYLGFVHVIDSMRNATLVFTRFAMVSTFTINNSFCVCFVHMIYIMRNFAAVVAHVVPFLMRVSDNM